MSPKSPRTGARRSTAAAGRTFRFEVGERVRVVSHPARPVVTVEARWAGAELRDPHDENAYRVAGFVTAQRESSLAAEGFEPLPLEGPAGWRLAGRGHLRRVGPGTVETAGGPGVAWYARERLADFVLLVDWRTHAEEDDSGVLLRIPRLEAGDPDHDHEPAVSEGYEVQIDERGLDPARGVHDSPYHRTGAVYGRAPALVHAAWPRGSWNTFAVEMRGRWLRVVLNGVEVSRLTDEHGRAQGYLGLQCHHEGARVRFRNLQLKRL